MALQGNCIYYELVETGETEEIKVIHPDGTEETITQPKMEEVGQEFNDVYVVIQKIDTFHNYIQTEDGVIKDTVVFCDIAGFESREARDLNPTDYLFFTAVPVKDFDYNLNIYEQAYNSVKKEKGFKNLTDI
tara:strand:- start:73 stop:468 length:396 start_codon:yes stop_codon:yes gene_type:complete